MYRRGLVNRFRHGPREEYIYHLEDRRSQKWAHWLNVNRFHFSLLRDLRGWQSIVYYDFEVRYPYGQADGFYVIKLTLQNDCLTFFLEEDDGLNKFDKIQKYLAYQQSKKWQGEWWGKDNFPLILIITFRKEEISDLIKKCNAEKFFRVVGKAKEYPEIIKSIKTAR